MPIPRLQNGAAGQSFAILIAPFPRHRAGDVRREHEPVTYLTCRTSSIGCMSSDCVNRSAPDLCPNMSASFSMATGATRASKVSPIQVEPIEMGSQKLDEVLFGATNSGSQQ